MNENFIVLTTYDIANAEIEEHLGLVQGSTVRARNFGSDLLAGIKKCGWRRVGRLFKTFKDFKRAGLCKND